MKIAIAECFPDTRYRLCMWHIMMKLGTKVGAALCNRTDFKRCIYDIVWTDQILLEIFEREWECMINEFQLGENKWYIERKNDHDSRYKTLAFKTDLAMEKEACKLYTRTLFFDVQYEMFALYKYCIALSAVQTVFSS
ncbi:FAR1-related sequence 5-like protein [Tanacetum coccineum]